MPNRIGGSLPGISVGDKTDKLYSMYPSRLRWKYYDGPFQVAELVGLGSVRGPLTCTCSTEWQQASNTLEGAFDDSIKRMTLQNLVQTNSPVPSRRLALMKRVFAEAAKLPPEERMRLTSTVSVRDGRPWVMLEPNSQDSIAMAGAPCSSGPPPAFPEHMDRSYRPQNGSRTSCS
jgi:hypothetical protein